MTSNKKIALTVYKQAAPPTGPNCSVTLRDRAVKQLQKKMAAQPKIVNLYLTNKNIPFTLF